MSMLICGWGAAAGRQTVLTVFDNVVCRMFLTNVCRMFLTNCACRMFLTNLCVSHRSQPDSPALFQRVRICTSINTPFLIFAFQISKQYFLKSPFLSLCPSFTPQPSFLSLAEYPKTPLAPPTFAPAPQFLPPPPPPFLHGPFPFLSHPHPHRRHHQPRLDSAQ